MFSENLKKLIDSSFENTNFGRILLLDRFEKLINQVGFSNKLSVAVIGGTKDEPEITLLKSMGFDLDVYTYGIEDYDDFYFDLNEENKKDTMISKCR